MEQLYFSERLTAGIYLLLVLLIFFVLLLYGTIRQGWLLGLVMLPLLVMVATHLLGRVAKGEEKKTQEQRALAELATTLVPLSTDQPALQSVLGTYLPELFPGCQIAIWADADSLLFSNHPEKNLPLTVMNVRLATESTGNLVWSWQKGVPAGLLVGFPDRPAGGLYLQPPAGHEPAHYQEIAQQVAAAVSGQLVREEALAEALAEQAESYEEALFSEAYRAEVFAQTLTLRQMEQELAVAWQIQASLLPADAPNLAGWQVTAALEPARQMSGDFYDFIPLPGGRVGLVVADVADKGLGPALYMALCRTLIRSYAELSPTRPEQVLAAANRRILNETNSDLFVTVFYAILNPNNGQIQYCNAGHNPPFLFRSPNSGNPQSVTALTRTALPLGILENLQATHATDEMGKGDMLVLYTDGITEAQDEFEDFYGETRLRELIARNCDRPAQIVGEKLVADVYDFMGAAPQHDDITLVLVARTTA